MGADSTLGSYSYSLLGCLVMSLKSRFQIQAVLANHGYLGYLSLCLTSCSLQDTVWSWVVSIPCPIHKLLVRP